MKNRREHINAEQLREVVHYNPHTGVFTRLVKSKKGSAKAGDIAGSTEKTGYRALWVLGTKYLAHRLAWLYMTGEWPPQQIDHINHNRADNRFVNLRLATNMENQFNRLPKKGSRRPAMGVQRNKGKWSAEIRAQGVRHYLGTFETVEEASDAYRRAKVHLHGGLGL